MSLFFFYKRKRNAKKFDNEKNVNEIIAKSVELLKKEKEAEKPSGLIENSKEISVLPDKTPEDFENNKNLYFSMIKNLGFKLDSYETQYDFENLAVFLSQSLKQTSNQPKIIRKPSFDSESNLLKIISSIN